MATTNFTEDGNQTSYQGYCSEELTTGIHSQIMFLSVLNIFLSITAFLGNTLTLVALHKETSLHPPSKLLYRNLATTDLCVGIIAQPLAAATWMSTVNERRNICRYADVAFNMTACILCLVSFYTSTAISVDRLLALLLGLRYRQVVTLKRSYLTVTSFWVVATVGTIMIFWSVYSDIIFWCSIAVTFTCLVTSIFCYAKIFRTLRRHEIQVQDHVHQGQPSQTIPMNIARYRKAVFSALWVQLTLIVCYIPYGIVGTYLALRGFSSSVYLALLLTSVLVFLNSSLNPVLYCWKIKEVRQAMKDTIRQFGC